MHLHFRRLGHKSHADTPQPGESQAAAYPDEAAPADTEAATDGKGAPDAENDSAVPEGWAARLLSFFKAKRRRPVLLICGLFILIAAGSGAAFLFSQGPSEPPVASSAGSFHASSASPDPVSSRLPAYMDPSFASSGGSVEGRKAFIGEPRKGEDGIYSIPESAMRNKQKKVSPDAGTSLEALFYDCDLAVTRQIFFEADGDGGYNRCDPTLYTAAPDTSGELLYSRTDSLGNNVYPIMITYRQYGDRYDVDWYCNYTCNTYLQSGNGRYVLLTRYEPLDYRPSYMLFCPAKRTLTALPLDTSDEPTEVNSCSISGDGRFIAFIRNNKNWVNAEDTFDEAAYRNEICCWDAETGTVQTLADLKQGYVRNMSWKGNALYWSYSKVEDDGRHDTTGYFKAEFPGGKPRRVFGTTEGPGEATGSYSVYLNSAMQKQYLYLQERASSEPLGRVYNLDTGESVTLQIPSSEKFLAVQSPVFTDDGRFLAFQLMPDYAYAQYGAPAQYLCVCSADDGSARIYRLPESTPSDIYLSALYDGAAILGRMVPDGAGDSYNSSIADIYAVYLGDF